MQQQRNMQSFVLIAFGCSHAAETTINAGTFISSRYFSTFTVKGALAGERLPDVSTATMVKSELGSASGFLI